MSEDVLKVENLSAGYGSVRVLHDVSLEVNQGEIVVLLGANGAGKTTTLRALNGTIAHEGSVRFWGKEPSKGGVAEIMRSGVATVPQGRGTFGDLTVRENLLVGAHVRNDRREIAKQIDHWYEVFPRLGERSDQSAGTLSGGEQQMLAIARALMSEPKLLLLDEPSLGLAPLIVQELFVRLGEINKESGIAMCIVEQSAELALDIAHRGFVLEAGRTVLGGLADELRGNEAIRRAYLGM